MGPLLVGFVWRRFCFVLPPVLHKGEEGGMRKRRRRLLADLKVALVACMGSLCLRKSGVSFATLQRRSCGRTCLYRLAQVRRLKENEY